MEVMARAEWVSEIPMERPAPRPSPPLLPLVPRPALLRAAGALTIALGLPLSASACIDVMTPFERDPSVGDLSPGVVTVLVLATLALVLRAATRAARAASSPLAAVVLVPMAASAVAFGGVVVVLAATILPFLAAPAAFLATLVVVRDGAGLAFAVLATLGRSAPSSRPSRPSEARSRPVTRAASLPVARTLRPAAAQPRAAGLRRAA